MLGKRRSRARPAAVRPVLGAAALAVALAVAGCGSQRPAPRPVAGSEAANNAFLERLRSTLAERRPVGRGDHPFLAAFQRTGFPADFHGFAITLYQPGQRRLRAIRRGYEGFDNLRRAVNRLLESPRLEEFALQDPRLARIQIDFLPAPFEPVESFSSLALSGLGPDRFEIGVDGLRIEHGGRVRYLLPGDAFVVSLLSRNQLESWVRRQFEGVDPDALALERFRSASFVSHGERWLPLYRGYPVVASVDAPTLEAAARAGVEYLRRTQKEDGRFQYYYDAARDSYRDHMRSPEAEKKSPYYNILRHAGTSLLLLAHYERYGDESVLESLRPALAFLDRQLVPYATPEGRDAAYVFYNRKAKLGGSGLGLALLVEYQRLTGSDEYRDSSRLLAEHLLSEIRPNGEFYYYHVFPNRLKTDRVLFSFYYPGEALLGLARYYKHAAAEGDKQRLRQKIGSALRFLLEDRPLLYADKFTSLPSDSWLMIAIDELWDAEELRSEDYLAFVLGDADTMVRQMYGPEDALYPDYVGSFYYDYGDHPYPDGARAEGLLAAYRLSLKAGRRAHSQRYHEALQRLSWALYHLVNTEESTYAVARPDRAIGGIRFKLTRQWFRLDTIQHVAAMFLGFVPYWPEGAVYRPEPPPAAGPSVARNPSPHPSIRASSLSVQSQSEQAHGSSPVSSRHRPRLWAS